jgi:hypothetical protein
VPDGLDVFVALPFFLSFLAISSWDEPITSGPIGPPQSLRLLLGRRSALAGDRPAGATSGAGVGARSLPVRRKISPVANSSVAVDLNEALNVLSHLASQVAFHYIFAVDDLADAIYLVVAEVTYACVGAHPCLLEYLPGAGLADAEDVAQRYFYAFFAWNINACDSSHS